MTKKLMTEWRTGQHCLNLQSWNSIWLPMPKEKRWWERLYFPKLATAVSPIPHSVFFSVWPSLFSRSMVKTMSFPPESSWPFGMHGPIAYGRSGTMWVWRLHHKSSIEFSGFLSWDAHSWNPAPMLWACPSMDIERHALRGTEALVHVLSWASSWEPVSTCQPSWKGILQPPAKLLQLLVCGTETS